MNPQVHLRREQETMLMTLYLHALDAAAARPILGDGFAAGLLERVEYSPARLNRLRGQVPAICTRARLIDEVVRDFLDRHADAVVLHLGCGLDSRVLRLDPGPGVDWWEVDQAPVIELRERLYPARPGVSTVAASVTDPAWWSRVPQGRPQLVVAEGLLMYLSPGGVRATVDAALGRAAPNRTLVCDTVAPWVRRIARWQPTMRSADVAFSSGGDDVTAAIAAHPELTLRAEESVTGAAARATTGAMSAFLRLFDAIPGGHRAMVLRTYATR